MCNRLQGILAIALQGRMDNRMVPGNPPVTDWI
jgi:hypothetical protein